MGKNSDSANKEKEKQRKKMEWNEMVATIDTATALYIYLKTEVALADTNYLFAGIHKYRIYIYESYLPIQ